MLREMKTVREKVKAILADNLASRDNDRELIKRIAFEYTDNFIQFEAFCNIIDKMPSFKSISRERRLLQREGWFPGEKRLERE